MRINPPSGFPLPSPLSSEDLQYVLENLRDVWEMLRGRRIFLTGGTGFFGRWLLESLLAANQAFDLRAEAVVLTRSPETFCALCPHLGPQDGLQFVTGDVRDFAFPAGHFDFILHAATETVSNDAPGTFSTIVDGTRRCLAFAEASGARKFLLTSSGAVYGKQPAELSHIPEEYLGGPETLLSGAAYGEGKRAAETLCAMYGERTGLECKIARCFAFVGPHLPLDAHFAVGNFLRDAVRGGPIAIAGDGTPMRSYLYAADLAVWLWTILLKARSLRAFNVGSDQAVSIRELAQTVADVVSAASGSEASGRRIEVRIAQEAVAGAPRAQYVPLIDRARKELGLTVGIALPEAIRRTAAYVEHFS